jgi:hypothetical protein
LQFNQRAWVDLQSAQLAWADLQYDQRSRPDLQSDQQSRSDLQSDQWAREQQSRLDLLTQLQGDELARPDQLDPQAGLLIRVHIK